MYKVGECIVYPMHGAGIIKDIEEKDILDSKQLYYVLDIASERMEILIPVEKADEIGVRHIIHENMIKEVMGELDSEMDRMDSNWNKRYQENMNQLKSGDIMDVARVYRNLAILDQRKGLSSGEKKMLYTARNFLVSEISLVEGLEKDEAISMIEARVAV